MIDEQEKRIEEPFLEEIEANDEWLLLRVEPIVERVNRTLSWLFGGDDPAQLLLKRKRTRSRTSQTEEGPSRKDELLGGARERLPRHLNKMINHLNSGCPLRAFTVPSYGTFLWGGVHAI
jgi:hypothetical protein